MTVELSAPPFAPQIENLLWTLPSPVKYNPDGSIFYFCDIPSSHKKSVKNILGLPYALNGDGYKYEGLVEAWHKLPLGIGLDEALGCYRFCLQTLDGLVTLEEQGRLDTGLKPPIMTDYIEGVRGLSDNQGRKPYEEESFVILRQVFRRDQEVANYARWQEYLEVERMIRAVRSEEHHPSKLESPQRKDLTEAKIRELIAWARKQEALWPYFLATEQAMLVRRALSWDENDLWQQLSAEFKLRPSIVGETISSDINIILLFKQAYDLQNPPSVVLRPSINETRARAHVPLRGHGRFLN